uniref:CBF domain-containing protein n=1 Tax=Schistocephalus solidus TaxID=70667 RepID=A0A183TMY6_SCHSO
LSTTEAPPFNIGYYETQAKNIFDLYIAGDGHMDDTDLCSVEDRLTREWLSTVLKRGTGRDRVIALAYLVKAKPRRCLRHLESLLAMISPAKKQICLKAIDVLTDLFDGALLPSTRSLISFEKRPFETLKNFSTLPSEDLSVKAAAGNRSLSANSREFVLSLWYFENQLKQIYSRFISALEVIMGILVNKLGDRSKNVTSGVIHKLRGLSRLHFYSVNCSLVSQHPNLKSLLVEQLRILLFRPNLVQRAKYYAIVLLSCVPLSKQAAVNSDSQPDGSSSSTASLAAILFKIYIGFFKAAVEADELPERLTTALLTGISRVAPYLSGEIMSSNVADIDSVFRLVHLTSNFTISLQALNFLFHFTTHQPQLRDRYYQSLYRKLADQSVRWTSRGPSLLHLIYQSMLVDDDSERLSAFVQRLLVVCLTHPDAGFISAALILLEKLRSSGRFSIPIICLTQHPLQTMVFTHEHYLQTHTSIDSYIFALIKIDENQKMKPLLPIDVGVVKKVDNQASDSDEELFVDVSASENDEEGGEAQSKTTELPKKAITASWEHRQLNSCGRNRHSSASGKNATVGYDSSVRDPRFARALHQPCWQLLLASRHAHPTVSLFANNLLVGQLFKYTGNPFDDLSVLQFIERFAYKKPKSVTSGSKAKAAVMSSPRLSDGQIGDAVGRLHNRAPRKDSSPTTIDKFCVYTGALALRVSKPDKIVRKKAAVQRAKTLAVDSAAYRNLTANQVPSDERFIHSYFNFLEKSGTKKEHDSDISVSDEEFDSYLSKYCFPSAFYETLVSNSRLRFTCCRKACWETGTPPDFALKLIVLPSRSCFSNSVLSRYCMLTLNSETNQVRSPVGNLPIHDSWLVRCVVVGK